VAEPSAFDQTAPMALKDLLRTADLTVDDMAQVLDLAAHLKAHPHDRSDLLAHEGVAVYFNKPSTRTRLSFATAITRLGGTPTILGPSDLQLGRGETIEDTARVLSRMMQAFVIRTFADDEVARFAAAASIPVINALTDGHHPCQSLADLLTIREIFGRLDGITVAYVGDGDNNVTHSLMEGCALVGAAIRVGSPEGHQPQRGVTERARAIAATTGGQVEITDSVSDAVRGADVVYTDTWMSMGIAADQERIRFESLRPYQVNDELMALAAPHAVFLHDLPAHRGEEVTADVMDGPRSHIWDQAHNRLCTSQAMLVALLEGRLTGTAG
jgi:ornithine carbamoyltransferase